jgi:cytidylate kinase
MPIAHGHLPAGNIAPADKTLRAAIQSWNNTPPGAIGDRPPVFVTVGRQPGAGAISFSHRLAARLNESANADWSAWDRELVEKVSAEHGIAKEIIEMIPNRHHNWLDELLQNFSQSMNPPDLVEIRAYRRVAMTIRALAMAGHAIIVGQGGTFITEKMPSAIHLRLVAPLEHRIKYTAERDEVALRVAAAKIVEIDHRRAEFYRRYWPTKAVAPETFTMTLNSTELSVDELVECVFPVVRSREGAVKGTERAREVSRACAAPCSEVASISSGA